MEELKKSSFMVKDNEGKDIECDVLFTFDSEETKKSYIVYTDNTTDEEGNVKVFASIYDPKVENPVLEAITDEKEWKIIETILETLQDEKNS